MPDVYDLAEIGGVPPEDVDRWRLHTLSNSEPYFDILFSQQFLKKSCPFNIILFIKRYRHLEDFKKFYENIRNTYLEALEKHHPMAFYPISHLDEAANSSKKH